MAGGGERNRNCGSNDSEQEQYQSRRLNGVLDVIHGDSSSHQHGHYDFQANCNNDVGLVFAVGESSHQINLNPQEGGPLGLSLRRSKSLAKLIETHLTKEKQLNIRREESLSRPNFEKLKASNFHAIFLQIGSWNWESQDEGDLVVKIYYAKKQLLWEFLFGSLKRKIEIPWSNISAINASINERENGILEIELKERPLFAQEINNQPQRHTEWTPITDFTRGQASICRRHKVEFLPGILDKHFKKFSHSDNRLLHLSRQIFPVNNSPFFPHTNLNFLHNASVPGENCHQQELISHAQNHVPPTDPFVGQSSSCFLPSASNARISQELQKSSVQETRRRFQIEQPSLIPIQEEDHLLQNNGSGSMILDPEVELYLDDKQIDQHGYLNNEVVVNEQSLKLPLEGPPPWAPIGPNNGERLNYRLKPKLQPLIGGSIREKKRKEIASIGSNNNGLLLWEAGDGVWCVNGGRRQPWVADGGVVGQEQREYLDFKVNAPVIRPPGFAHVRF
ncbi:hypothetical protein L2E82_24626 [Cichorium intybus]|uniref:Uncharacterized protein n=1 Tax=Cichorium intybus TaxID=13427 RepID=A0ACB9E2A3_CICIN|nr:hypothetical protein L2E82_24626 [Cichorium intybus]